MSPTYPLLACAVIVIPAALDFLLKTNVLREMKTWKTIAVLLAMTAVFDMVITGLPIVTYDASRLSGVFLGSIPIEDFSYCFAATVLTLSLIRSYERHD